jgi:alkylhydroperoxidase family enzyme
MEAARISPAMPPFAPAVQSAIDAVMRGRPPLVLFTTLARDARLAGKFFAGGLLDRGHLTLRQREIVILRTTARCGSAYEWGVHVAAFGAQAGFDAVQLQALAHGSDGAHCWSAGERVLIALCDALHEHCDVDAALWQRLTSCFTDEALLELLLLAGFYRTVSYLGNALRLPAEPGTPGLPAVA